MRYNRLCLVTKGCRERLVTSTSPESLSLPRFREMLYSDHYQEKLAVFAVDEAHCILSW